MMKKALVSIANISKIWFPPIFILVAGWFLWSELKQIHIKQITESFYLLSISSVVTALTLTTLNYSILAGYDFLALRLVRHDIKFKKIVYASFLSYSFSYNFGFIFGNALRSRIYNALGLTVSEISQTITFLFITFWLGFFGIAGLVFTLSTRPLPELLSLLPLNSSRPLGLALLFTVVLFLLAIHKKKTIRLSNFTWHLPNSRAFILQFILAGIDWVLAAGILYVLLQHALPLSFWQVLTIYLLAQFASAISHIPGGIAVFESTFLILLPANTNSTIIISSLLIYRVIYYLIPLLLAISIFGIKQLIDRRQKMQIATQKIEKLLLSSTSMIMSSVVFVSGVILLISGALPAEHSRLELLRVFIPLPVIEISHFLASIIGIFLLFLARLIRKRVTLAYYVTIILLVAGIIFSLTKGFDYEEALILLVMLLVLIPTRRIFNRRDSLFTSRITYSWLFSIILVVSSTIWLGLFAYKHIEYTNELWWTFILKSDASRFLRASVGVVISLVVLTGSKLFRSRYIEPFLPSQEQLNTVALLAAGSKKTGAYLGLLRDKFIMFNSQKNGFIMYGIMNRSAIALGDPIANSVKAQRELLFKFRAYCDRQDLRMVFYQITSEQLPLYLDMGLIPLKIGEEALVNTQTFTLAGSHKKPLRYINNHLADEGYNFVYIPVDQTSHYFPMLKRISDAWLKIKKTKEKGFSLGVFDESYLTHFPIALIQNQQGKIVAFANLFLGSEKYEFSVDLMRYDPEQAPRDVMTYLFLKLIDWGKAKEYKYLSLGVAPLSGIDQSSLAPLLSKACNMVYRHGEYFYNFEGLRTYKNKFDPIWEPRYLATPGALSSVSALRDVVTLISGGTIGLIKK